MTMKGRKPRRGGDRIERERLRQIRVDVLGGHRNAAVKMITRRGPHSWEALDPIADVALRSDEFQGKGDDRSLVAGTAGTRHGRDQGTAILEALEESDCRRRSSIQKRVTRVHRRVPRVLDQTRCEEHAKSLYRLGSVDGQ